MTLNCVAHLCGCISGLSSALHILPVFHLNQIANIFCALELPSSLIFNLYLILYVLIMHEMTHIADFADAEAAATTTIILTLKGV